MVYNFIFCTWVPLIGFRKQLFLQVRRRCQTVAHKEPVYFQVCLVTCKENDYKPIGTRARILRRIGNISADLSYQEFLKKRLCSHVYVNCEDFGWKTGTKHCPPMYQVLMNVDSGGFQIKVLVTLSLGTPFYNMLSRNIQTPTDWNMQAA